MLTYMDSFQEGISWIFPLNLMTLKLFGGDSEHLTELVFFGGDFREHWCGTPGDGAAPGIVTQ